MSDVKRSAYLALFLVTLDTLMLEILLTRILSVVMWYHFAFMAVSIAMFGMTAGSLAVFLFPKLFPTENTIGSMANFSIWFSLATFASFLILWFLPHITSNALSMLAASYIVASIPFAMSGIIVCLALTRFPKQLSKLYSSDLAGAATGCVVLIYLLDLTDAASVTLAICSFSMLAAWLFAPPEFRKVKRIALVGATFMLFSFAVNSFLSISQKHIFHFSWTKGRFRPDPLYVKWNSFSRIQVFPDPNNKPFGWGFSPQVDLGPSIDELYLDIDGSAGTVLTRFDGNLANIEYLKYDVTNFAHHLRKDANIFVIGVGGGRDLLSALAFQQKSVTGVEINENILSVMNEQFGEFTGHLNRDPKIMMINDEARSYLTRQQKQFDLIQVSLIDTWAATAAGAFVLAENSLYTVDAWKIFIERLTNTGILSFSRWYSPDRPVEVYKLTSLARAGLIESGVQDPAQHLMLITNHRKNLKQEAIATLLVGKSAFTKKDLRDIDKICKSLNFKVLFNSVYYSDPVFLRILKNRKMGRLSDELKPPSDNRPFFFSSFQWKTLARGSFWVRGLQHEVPSATFILAALMIIVIFLSLLCIVVPLFIARLKPAPGSGLYLAYFAAIGMGFMLVEISQMQRLMIFLGHPTYSLSVVLLSLLLSGGIGSYFTNRIEERALGKMGRNLLLLLLVMLLVLSMMTEFGVQILKSNSNTMRILFSVFTLSIAGFMMGMAFPIGMKSALLRFKNVGPWFWGVNGATSVCASVVAVIISISEGISTTFWIGFGFYSLACVAFIIINRKIADV